jgi:iron-sulfur cluster assembly protein
MITVSEKAKEQILKLQKEFTTEHFLRVSVKGAGCSGLQYNLDFDTDLEDGDQVFEDKGIKIVCNKKSLLYLFGTELDYSDGLKGKGFEWNNPSATRVCSCKQSFSV